MSTLFPGAEKIARWILRHDRRHQRELGVIREAADRAEAVALAEPMMHPDQYPDETALAVAQLAWEAEDRDAMNALTAVTLSGMSRRYR